MHGQRMGYAEKLKWIIKNGGYLGASGGARGEWRGEGYEPPSVP
jgi:hypothetical protein